MTNMQQENWKKLAEQAASEKDPKKLMELAEQLSKALAAVEPESHRLEIQPLAKGDADSKATS